MDVEQLEAEARATAAKHVANMLQRPDQLEKVDQYKRRVSRKKASVEAMLKTALQSQLDGVRTGLNQLQTALQDIQEIKQSLQEIDGSFQALPALCEQLQDVREENMRHSQYATAMENLKHIFTVPESVEKTQQLINDSKLLHAHQCLMDLENSRDDLLYELHKLPNQSLTDKNMLKAYFAEVEKLSDMLGKQLWLVLGRTLDTVRQDQTSTVTALRIIEREEKADSDVLLRQKQSGFLPPGRPKRWLEKAMSVLKDAVAERIEGTQHEDHSDNKMWLVRQLEFIRKQVVDDLKVVNILCKPCFPPHYNIMDKFVKMYHDSLALYLEELIQNGLEGNEYVSFLSWVMNTYAGEKMMLSPELNLEPKDIEPLLDNSVIESLLQKYLKNIEQKYTEWMQKMIAGEINDWRKDSVPESDGEGYFHTSAAVIIFQMIDQHLQVSCTISQDLMIQVFILGMEQVVQYGKLYREAIIAFKSSHFEDRSVVPYFTHYMIAIVNNCLHFVELAQQMKQRYWKLGPHNNEASQKYEMMLNCYQHLRDEAASYLVEEAFLDLEPHFTDLITQKWFVSSIPVDTICVTLEDYFQDYVHLRVQNFDRVITEAQNWVAKRYVTAMLQKRITFKNYEERRDAADKILKEADQIKAFFLRIAPTVAKSDSPFDTIQSLAEVLKVQDVEFLSLELHGLVKKYPDMTQDHLVCLLSLRGDIGRMDVRQKAVEIIPENQLRGSVPIPKSIFSQINVQSSLFM